LMKYSTDISYLLGPCHPFYWWNTYTTNTYSHVPSTSLWCLLVPCTYELTWILLYTPVVVLQTISSLTQTCCVCRCCSFFPQIL
jgi:hypothetical protein